MNYKTPKAPKKLTKIKIFRFILERAFNLVFECRRSTFCLFVCFCFVFFLIHNIEGYQENKETQRNTFE